MNTTHETIIAAELMHDINKAMGEDFHTLFDLRPKPIPEDPILAERQDKAEQFIRDITNVSKLYPFTKDVSLNLFLRHAPRNNRDLPAGWDISAALVAAYHSQMRVPEDLGARWALHIQSAENTCKAAESIEGEILTCAALTIHNVIYSKKFGYSKPLEGFPVDVANNVREWMFKL